MRSLEEIQKEIKTLPTADIWGTRKEVKELPNILFDDEHIKAMCSGLLEGNTWLIVCTNRRILFLDRGLLYGLKQRETPIEKINSVEQKKGLVFGSIAIWDGAAKMEIKDINKDAVPPFVNAVHEQIEAYKHKGEHTTQQTQSGGSVADELTKLKKLLDDGILTQEEFNSEKKKILSK
ncbi:PH domain-containing protein [Sporanaerobacter sp. PP17-6a]|uniref:PH domain-containing protein n=1 Tax=Sporanaerobacter sp. PP17-6a TaxID=1891289 RepID=UPI00089FF13B|nr:PH domain-containing protein [Sporanaerobacter sp. PP17-6a]SCL88039.1 hypothetical protein PP176A_1449 [Sporanaerobacter sp. PP17-6a]